MLPACRMLPRDCGRRWVEVVLQCPRAAARASEPESARRGPGPSRARAGDSDRGPAVPGWGPARQRAAAALTRGRVAPRRRAWRPASASQGTEPPSPSPPPSPICRGSGMAVPSPISRGSGVHPHRHPRFAGDRGSIPIAIPDLPESGIQLSTIEYCKGVEFRLPQCLTLRLIVLPKLINLRRPAMSDDAVDYSGTIIRHTQPRRGAIRLRSLSCRTCRLPWVTTSSR